MRIHDSILRAGLAASIAAALALPGPVQAESNTATGSGPLSSAAHLDFRIVFPRFLAFRVGTLGSTIDLITFTVASSNVGDGTAVAAAGGDAGGGSGVNVSVASNAGQVTIAESNNSGGNGLQHESLAEYVSFAEVNTYSSDTNLERPVLSDAGGNTSKPVLNFGNVTVRSAVWSYSYANTQVHSSGIFGTSAKGGRVTYTASTP